MSSDYVRGQRARIKGGPWGMTTGTRGRISRVFKPGQGSGYDAEFRVKGWHPMRVKKGEVETESKAHAIVNTMLSEAYDEHVKAHELVQKWDKAHDSFGKLYALKQKSMGLFREMGRSIAYERALARVGLSRKDVAAPIYGSQIGSTHNYKQTRPQRRCQNIHCNDRGPKPESQSECRTCGEPLVTKQMSYSPSDLRGKYARHLLGVETKDGRRIWFDAPLPPEPEPAVLEPEAPASPTTPKDMEEQRRLGKWW
jgi:hypothetical protein